MAPNLRKHHPLLKMINNSLIDLPTPPNISAWWNFGALLGICLMTQIITGLLLAMHYTADTTLAFTSVSHTSQCPMHLTNPKPPCKRSFLLFHLHLPTHWSSILLWLLPL